MNDVDVLSETQETGAINTHQNLYKSITLNFYRFVYTDQVGKQDMTLGLMVAANKYEIPVLFQKCQLELSAKLNAKNAAEYYLTAYLHDATMLQKSAMETIIDCYKEVKETKAFSKFYLHPKALINILDNVL